MVAAIVRAIRNARSEHDVVPGRRIGAIIAAGDQLDTLRQQAPSLQLLARVDQDLLRMSESVESPPDKALTLVDGGFECYLPLAELVDVDAERARVGSEIERIKGDIARSEKLLANAGFTSNAPEAVVQRERDKLVANQESLTTLEERLKSL